jgi:hypothetical protein
VKLPIEVKMNPVPVTNYDFTPEACAERVGRLLDSHPVRLAVAGGGLHEEHYVEFDQFALIHRDELREILRHLRRPPLFRIDAETGAVTRVDEPACGSA